MDKANHGYEVEVDDIVVDCNQSKLNQFIDFFDLPKMKYTSILVSKALIIRYNTEEQFGVQSQIGNSSQEPAVSQFSLLDVETRITFHE